MDTLDRRHDLIEACKRYDRQAQLTLYTDYADAMYNVAYRIVNNADDAKDVLQNAFIDVFRHLSTFKYDSTPGAWIKRIVINKALTLINKNARTRTSDLSDVPTDLSQEDDTAVSYDVTSVKSAIKKLPDGYRTVLTLYLIEGYDHKEIGQIMDISEATSKSQYSRAKAKLRGMLKQRENI